MSPTSVELLPHCTYSLKGDNLRADERPGPHLYKGQTTVALHPHHLRTEGEVAEVQTYTDSCAGINGCRSGQQ